MLELFFSKKTILCRRTCYYFDDVIKDIDINFSNILSDEKLYENISVYDISYKSSTGPKLLRIRFDKVDWFIRVRDDEFRYLVLFDFGLFDKICDKSKYLISEKGGITDNINHDFGNSYNLLRIEKILTFHNVTVLIKSVVNKNKNNCYYHIPLEKGLYKDKSDT